jgi:hypothetical protein
MAHKTPKQNEFGLPEMNRITPDMLQGLAADTEIDRKELAAAALAAGATIQVAARIAGVTMRAVYRWKLDPAFKGLMESAFRSHVEALKFESVRTIRQLLRKGPPEVKAQLASRIAEAHGALPVAPIVESQALPASNVLFLPMKSEGVDEPEDEG